MEQCKWSMKGKSYLSHLMTNGINKCHLLLKLSDLILQSPYTDFKWGCWDTFNIYFSSAISSHYLQRFLDYVDLRGGWSLLWFVYAETSRMFGFHFCTPQTIVWRVQSEFQFILTCLEKMCWVIFQHDFLVSNHCLRIS